MKPIVHWLRWEQKTSGLYVYTYALHKATLQLGYESHICYIDSDLKNGGTLGFMNPSIGIYDEEKKRKVIKASPWSVADGAINITHDSLPHMKLDNWVTEMHGHPAYAASDMNMLTPSLYKLGRAELIFTRFPSHIQYWREYTNAPIHVLPPGVDLEHWKYDGAKVNFTRPIILWGDTVREPIKSPLNLLYAMKIINRELPIYGLKLVGIPPQEIAGYYYLCGRLGLDSILELPIEPMVKNMDELYRGVRDVEGVMYTDTNNEGSNSSWEAEALGLPTVHHRDSPEEIAQAIIEQVNRHEKPVKARDIKETAKEMISVLESYYPDSRHP